MLNIDVGTIKHTDETQVSMPKFNAIIEGFVVGDSLTVLREILNVPSDMTMVNAWFTVKKSHLDSDEDAILQKNITTVESEDGVITAADEDSYPRIEFRLTPEETYLLSSNRKYRYDIQVSDEDNEHVYTLETGQIVGNPGITILPIEPEEEEEEED